MTICQHLLILMSFQTCMSFFLMLNTKKLFWRILKNQRMLVPFDFHSRERNTMEVNGDHHLVITSILQNILFYVQHKEKIIQVWNDMMVRKWWQKKYFWWPIPLTVLKSTVFTYHLLLIWRTFFQYKEPFVQQ